MAIWTNPAITPLAADGDVAVAFEGANGDLWTWQGQPGHVGTVVDQHLKMMGWSSPSITTLPNGNSGVAFEGANGDLWTWSGRASALGTSRDTGYAMYPYTNPSIAVGIDDNPNDASPSSIYAAVAFQGANGHLYYWEGAAGYGGSAYDTGLGMLYFTSPSITAIPEGNHYVALVAFEANTGHLWTWENFADAAGYGADTGLPMAEDEMATGPSIGVDVAGGGTAAVAFRGADGDLWTWHGYAGGDAINYADTGLPIAADTSPSIDTALSGSGVAAAFQAKNWGLWTWYGYAGTAGSGSPSGYSTPDGGVDPRSATSHSPREQPFHRLGLAQPVPR